MLWPVDMVRLVDNPNEAGLYCGKDQLTLGGVALLVQGASGLKPRQLNELEEIFKAAYAGAISIDPQSCFKALNSIASALNNDELARAMISSLMLRLPSLNPVAMMRLAKTESLLKANFNVLEPRNRDGEWSSEESSLSHPAGWTVTIPVPEPPILFPGISGHPKPKDDDYLFPPFPGAAGESHGVNDNASTDAQSAANDNRPQACPDPSYEPSSVKRTRVQLLYQAQISKLPIGWGVTLNGVDYDGCRSSDNFMLEAKSGNDWFVEVPDFIKPKLDEYRDMMDQAKRQNNNSGGRFVEWHFANRAASEYWAAEFLKAGFFHIFVRYTPYDEHYNYNLIRFDETRDLGIKFGYRIA